jgi:hypothetical protein
MNVVTLPCFLVSLSLEGNVKGSGDMGNVRYNSEYKLPPAYPGYHVSLLEPNGVEEAQKHS